MNFKDHLRQVMISYPDLFEKVIQVYDHIFLTNGNGYSWKDGALVFNGDLIDNVNDAINNVIDNNFSALAITNKCDHYKCKIKSQINRILRFDDLFNDLSLPSEFKFSELNKYSIIANIHDNVDYITLTYIREFLEIIDNHKNLLSDPLHLFDAIKNRVNFLFSIYDDEFTKVLDENIRANMESFI